MEDKNKITHTLCDDTLDIGKEPLKVERSKEVEKQDKKFFKELLKECTK
jgi:hypothetical protein